MIKVGLIGLGLIGKEHFTAYEDLQDVRLAKIADKNLAKSKDFLKGIDVSLTDDIDDIINDPQIDVVDICLPTHMHASVTEKAAKKGKHILCEKPMALTIEQCERMIKITAKNKVKLMIGHLLRFWPEYLTAKKIIKNGEIGQVKMFSGKRYVAYPQYSDSDWLQNEKFSGGAVFDLMIHDIDFVSWIFKKYRVKSIFASGLLSSKNSLDHIFAIIEYEGGINGCIEGGWLMPPTFPFSMNFQILGSNGVIKYDLRGISFQAEKDEEATKTMVVYDKEKIYAPELVPGSPMTSELRYFYNCIISDRYPQVITPLDAMQSVKLALLIRDSALAGKIVRL